MGLFSFFKKNKDSKSNNSDNEFLDIESSIYNTEAKPQIFQDNVNYQSLVYNEPTNTVRNYKAKSNNIGVVVDKDQFDYNLNDFNSNIKTYELQKDRDEEKVVVEKKEMEEPKEISLPIEEIKNISQVENVETSEQNDFIYKVDENINDTKMEEEFSIFSSIDSSSQKVVHKASDYNEKPVELVSDVTLTKDGYKTCPNCGTILNPNAAVCFMCSQSFIKK